MTPLLQAMIHCFPGEVPWSQWTTCGHMISHDQHTIPTLHWPQNWPKNFIKIILVMCGDNRYFVIEGGVYTIKSTPPFGIAKDVIS